MHIEYETKQLKQVCTIYSIAIKKHGLECAVKLYQRLEQLKAADSIEELIHYRVGRCHKLVGNYKECYAMDLSHPYRLIFNKINDESVKVLIVNIIDYH